MNCPDPLLQRLLRVDALLRLPCDDAVADDPNRRLFASLLTGQALGQGCLDRWLGCGEAAWRTMATAFFGGQIDMPAPRPLPPAIPEWSDLQGLLLEHRAGLRESENWVADIVASACAGSDHLWQDLGLTNRAELSCLMVTNFPTLAAANTGDMKWKKFLYRQFCARDGIYVCPAPSCGVCADYARCFGPEA